MARQWAIVHWLKTYDLIGIILQTFSFIAGEKQDLVEREVSRGLRQTLQHRVSLRSTSSCS